MKVTVALSLLAAAGVIAAPAAQPEANEDNFWPTDKPGFPWPTPSKPSIPAFPWPTPSKPSIPAFPWPTPSPIKPPGFPFPTPYPIGSVPHKPWKRAVETAAPEVVKREAEPEPEAEAEAQPEPQEPAEDFSADHWPPHKPGKPPGWGPPPPPGKPPGWGPPPPPGKPPGWGPPPPPGKPPGWGPPPPPGKPPGPPSWPTPTFPAPYPTKSVPHKPWKRHVERDAAPAAQPNMILAPPVLGA